MATISNNSGTGWERNWRDSYAYAPGEEYFTIEGGTNGKIERPSGEAEKETETTQTKGA